MVHPHSNTDTAIVSKKSLFILLDESYFRMIKNLSIEILTFAGRLLTSLSVDEMSLPMYMNQSTSFGGVPLRVAMASKIS